jgi:hypothetical protein
MKAIRYGIHFTTLAVAAIIFWLVRDFHLPAGISSLNLLHYALMGALHSMSIVVSLRSRRTAIHVAGFIALASALSAVVPFMGLFGSVEWAPLADILRESALSADAIFITGSIIGASGYWLLVQLFWFKTFRQADWFWAVAFSVSSTLLVSLGLNIFDEYTQLDSDADSVLRTFGWWLAFSTALYLSETPEHSHTLGGPQLGLVRKRLIGLGVGLPLMLVIWYFAAVWWEPMDVVTMALPERVRNTISRD